MTTPPSERDALLALPPALDDAPHTTPPPKAHGPARGAKDSGRFAVLNAFVDCELAQCSRAEIAAWLVLYRDTRNGTARIAQSCIAKRAGVDPRTVGRALGALQRRGLVRVLRRGGPNAGANLYRVSGTPQSGGKHGR